MCVLVQPPSVGLHGADPRLYSPWGVLQHPAFISLGVRTLQFAGLRLSRIPQLRAGHASPLSKLKRPHDPPAMHERAAFPDPCQCGGGSDSSVVVRCVSLMTGELGSRWVGPLESLPVQAAHGFPHVFFSVCLRLQSIWNQPCTRGNVGLQPSLPRVVSHIPALRPPICGRPVTTLCPQQCWPVISFICSDHGFLVCLPSGGVSPFSAFFPTGVPILGPQFPKNACGNFGLRDTSLEAD